MDGILINEIKKGANEQASKQKEQQQQLRRDLSAQKSGDGETFLNNLCNLLWVGSIVLGADSEAEASFPFSEGVQTNESTQPSFVTKGCQARFS